jgi:hypothetical protein
MGAGSNPAIWFVAVAFLLVWIRFWVDREKEAAMTETRACKFATRRKAPMKRKRTRIAIALFETIWAITANWAAALVTLPIHAKGRSQLVERPLRF